MSAESSRQRQASQTVILPQPVTDKSIIDSVAGFIHEVVPPAYTNVLHGENKERITWARFERPDLFDPFIFSEAADIDAYENAPLLLIVGYHVGAKVWSISINGESTEVLSLTDSVIKCLRLLPTPLSGSTSESCRKQDLFAHKRPLMALCDNAGSSNPFCLVNFISLRTGEQVKAIQFKTQVCDIQANRRSIAIVFPERIAVFDAFTLEDQLTVTTCFPSPSINPNPVALGSRWLAYAEKQLILMKRSRGGSEGEGVQSYTATVLQAAKTLSKGLRDFSGSVTSSLTGTGPVINGNNSLQPGIITILDVESSSGKSTKDRRGGEIIAHFIAHSEPIVAMNFDPSGMLLVTADKRGHRFHVFRINPHVAGSASASVHHLYILHRGDTTARVQDISFSNDSRWVAVSSLRGTTHVFPITPYGGSVGLRTHATPHVVNKLSRFHRSAGLTNDGRNSPILNECNQQLTMLAIPNPCLPPFPSPVVITPLAQLRTYPPGIPATRGHEDVSAMIKVSACFAPPRAWLSSSQETILNNKSMKRAVDSLFIITCHANLIQYDLEPKHVVGATKDRICDNTQIELGVEAKAEWPLVNSPSNTQPPLNANNPLLLMSRSFTSNSSNKYQNLDADERWLSQVEIVTHAGPHRRLWMGPQFTFKTFSSSLGGAVPVMDSDCGSRLNRSSPVNMPLSHNPIVPVLLESGSSSSFEQSPCLLDMCGAELEKMEGEGDSRLQEDLADAMQEVPGMTIPSDAGGGSMRARASVMARQVNPLGTVLTLSEGVSLAASIKTPDSNRIISKVVCCEQQSSHSPSSFDAPVNVDLSRPLSESSSDISLQEKIIYIDKLQTSIESNLSNSSNSVDVNTNNSQMVTVVELVPRTNSTTNSKIRSGGATTSESKESAPEAEKVSKTEKIVTEVIQSTPSISDSSIKESGCELSRSVPPEEPSKSSKSSKGKSKREKGRQNKAPAESTKQEEQSEEKEVVSEILSLPEPRIETEREEALISTVNLSEKKEKRAETPTDAQSLPNNPSKTSKKKKKEVQPVSLPKPCKNSSSSLEKCMPADAVIITNCSSEDETLDDKFESISFEEQTISADDPVIIKSHGVMSSIFDEHFRHPSVLEIPAEPLSVPIKQREDSCNDESSLTCPVPEPFIEIPCYVEKKCDEKSKPARGNRKSKKGKASNQKSEGLKSERPEDSTDPLETTITYPYLEQVSDPRYPEIQENWDESHVTLSEDFSTEVSQSALVHAPVDEVDPEKGTCDEISQSPLSEQAGANDTVPVPDDNIVKQEIDDSTVLETGSSVTKPVVQLKEPQSSEPNIVASKTADKPSKKKRGRKGKTNPSTSIKEDTKVEVMPILSYAAISKGTSETDSATSKESPHLSSKNSDNVEEIVASEERQLSGECQSYNAYEDFISEVDSATIEKPESINVEEMEMSATFECKLPMDSTPGESDTGGLQFELQWNAQELNSLNEDFLSLTTDDLAPCSFENQDEDVRYDPSREQSVETDSSGPIVPYSLFDSGSDFFIPHPLCSEDESGVDYVQITSMIMEDNLCDEVVAPKIDDTAEVNIFEHTAKDTSEEFPELREEDSPQRTCKTSDAPVDSTVTEVDDPLKISELMPVAEEVTLCEPCIAESAPQKKEAVPALSSKKNRKEKGRKGRGRR
nr:PREDICTED: uncharacterized protein LOC109037683 isoform X2 [Bemisia tabaci]XP_018908005.1 PREDICTED: uncharacterized protein LOC109037683 isoform X2 [Bemisia tabaci]